ncbi:MAG: DUF814 domain-containing protein [Candidatus Micrarchaeota archaeon]|nr:DUF814 domain-containing protein [Candidatus Micrarchaeota archaeon]
MKIKLFRDLSVYENAAYYFEKAKKLKKKLQGMYKALEELDKKIEEARQEIKRQQEQLERAKKHVEKQEWYERFNWSFTSEGKLVLIGKDAPQNEVLVRRYLEPKDLFFHADIQGASTVILKKGQEASERELLEAAQLAASYSRAWKEGLTTVNVYAVKPEQVKKASQGEYLGTGGFLIVGERKWFKHTPLGLKIGLKDGKLWVVPAISKIDLEKQYWLKPGGPYGKGQLAKKLSPYYNIHPDYFLSRLPAGKFSLKQ